MYFWIPYFVGVKLWWFDYCFIESINACHSEVLLPREILTWNRKKYDRKSTFSISVSFLFLYFLQENLVHVARANCINNKRICDSLDTTTALKLFQIKDQKIQPGIVSYCFAFKVFIAIKVSIYFARNSEMTTKHDVQR